MVQNISKSVVKGLREAARIPADSHPDADLLTAFAEQSLAEGERGRVMAHLADCGDCRYVISLALSEVQTVSQPHPWRVGGIGWFTWPALRWGALAAGVLAVTSVGVQQYTRSSREKTVPPVTANNSAASLLHQSRKEVVPQPDVQSEETASKPARAAESMASVEGHIAGPAPVARALFAKSNPAKKSNSRVDVLKLREDQLARNEGGPTFSEENRGLDIVKAKDPVRAQTTGDSAAGPLISSPSMPLQTSPSLMSRASPRWNVTSTGLLQRSFDGGTSWESINPSLDITAGVVPVFRAVAANGLEVWAGGSAGMLFHTADGGNLWIRVAPSTPGTTLSGDITSIQFSDPLQGTVTTSTDETWTTSDTGLTWQKQ